MTIRDQIDGVVGNYADQLRRVGDDADYQINELRRRNNSLTESLECMNATYSRMNEKIRLLEAEIATLKGGAK